MTFLLVPKVNGTKLEVLKLTVHGSREEAFRKASKLATHGAKLFDAPKFSIRVERVDKPARGYEVGADGHTIETD